MAIGCLGLSMNGKALSILDIKHSITDDNVIAPESFETKTKELEENFFLKHYASRAAEGGTARTGTPQEYEEYLSKLPAEIELPYNAIVGKFIDMYLGKRRTLVADMLALNNYYGNIFVEELLKENLPLELQYLPVIESALNPNAVSRAGAVGLWQIMPATATGLGLEVNSLVDQRRDPRLSTRYAVKYLKQLYDIYGDWSLAIAAYNCGPGNVNKALRRAGGNKKDYWEIYPYLHAETRGYVPAFIAANYVMNYYNKYGINPTLLKNKLITDTVLVNNRVHFNQIAEVLNIPVEEIRMLNPQFRKDIIPGDNHPYALVLPSQQCLSYIMSENAILNCNAESYARRTKVEPGESLVTNADGSVTKLVRKNHTVGRGENLRDIAKKYGVSATDIKRWNKMQSGKVKTGQKLIIEVLEKDSSESPALAENANVEAQTSSSDSSAVLVSKEENPMPEYQANAEPVKVPVRQVSGSTAAAKT
ncbi:MAG: transglycosylase SLT domain-containing protein, partial [Paramuribaculum sp.]|nr:transglycosylase SLT domain-containing protein [Paramuribaculum sp.]